MNPRKIFCLCFILSFVRILTYVLKSDDQKSLVDLAKMAEQMERYDDMVLNMVNYAKLGLGLLPEVSQETR